MTPSEIKIDWQLLVVVAAAASSRALISGGVPARQRASAAAASIAFAYIMTPAVLELIAGYSGPVSEAMSGAVGASIAIAAEPMIRHIYELAKRPAAIADVAKSAIELIKIFFGRGK
ncbi:hypothetical protein E2974_15970 [Paracoccus yeei]|uniref:hypothetical protein n=1 Tax=Paracoccus yeei TaxID=147645 RepID=UPI0037D45D46